MIVLILMTSIHFPLNTKQDNFFSFHDLQVVDTSGPPPARHAPSASRLGGRPLLRSCTDCCCWAPWPWRTGGWDPRGSPRRSSCHSGCQTVTGWRRKAPPKKKKKKKEVGLCLSLCWMMEPVVAGLTFVVGPSSFSATQLCRLKARSWQFTNTRLPNFSSNCFTSGSIPEKSSF